MQMVTLCAELAEDAENSSVQHQVRGESRIPRSGAPIERVFLQPSDVQGYGEALQALLDADLIVVGPGSLYTSILPNLLVKDVTAALRASKALKIYVCNLATQAGETDGYDAADHVRAIYDHVGESLFDYVLVNDNLEVQKPANWNAEMVKVTTDGPHRFWSTDLVEPERPWRHDPTKLARSILGISASHQRRR